MNPVLLILTLSGLLTGTSTQAGHPVRIVNPALLNQARSSKVSVLPRVVPLVEHVGGLDLYGFGTGAVPSVSRVSGHVFTPESGATVVFDNLVSKAVRLCPDWLRQDLTMQFVHMDAVTRERWARIIVDSKPAYRDETAFLVAHIGVEELSKPTFDTQVVTDQAPLIYQEAGKVGWATLVEHGDAQAGGDYWTTVRLHYTKDGKPVDYEVPRDYYYWFVVHPREDAEPLQTTNPQSGADVPPPVGRTWREYYPNPVTGTREYTDHLLFRVDKVYPQGPLGKDIRAFSVIKPVQHAALDLVQGPAGELAMVEMRMGKGSILATTIPVEKLFTDKGFGLLKNMMLYGDGNALDHTYYKHLILTQRTEADEPVAAMFKDRHAAYTLVSAQDFGQVNLDDYDRLTVTGGNDKALYQAVVARKDAIEKWIAKGHKLDLMLAANESIAGLVFPGDIQVKDVPRGVSPLSIKGWPAFWNVIPDTGSLWDGKAYKSKALPGNRVLDPDSFGLDKIGWFVGVSMPDNIRQHYEKAGLPPPRFVHAVSVIYHHVGNCGELEDVITAALRSTLVPTANSMDSAEDHVWNEVYLGNQWHPFEVSWNQGATFIDDYSISMEKKFGGGKDISTVISLYGDGRVLNRTPAYTDTFTLDLEVKDKTGAPVNGAWVTLFSEGYYKDNNGKYPLYPVYFGLTGPDGHLKVKLGDNQNFYVMVKSVVGNAPEQANTVAQVVADKDAKPDAVIAKVVQLGGELQRPSIDAQNGESTSTCNLYVDLLSQFYWDKSPFTGTSFMQKSKVAPVTIMLVDKDGLQALQSGKTKIKPLAAAVGVTHNASFRLEKGHPDVYLVVYPQEGVQNGVLYHAHVQCIPGPDGDVKLPETAPDNGSADSAGDSGQPDIRDMDAVSGGIPDRSTDIQAQTSGGGGCDTGQDPQPWSVILLLVALAAMVFLRRSFNR